MAGLQQQGWITAEAVSALGLLAIAITGSAVDLRTSTFLLRDCRKDLRRISDLLEIAPNSKSNDSSRDISGNNSSTILTANGLSVNCTQLSAEVTQCTVLSESPPAATNSGISNFLKRGQRLLIPTDFLPHNGGFTLLEVITSLGLLALIFAASFPLLKTDVVATKRIEATVEAEIELLFVRTQIETAAASASKICILDGTFPTNQKGDALLQSGDALGFIIPAPSLVFHPPGSNRGLSPVVCSNRPWSSPADSPSLSDIDHWLAVGIDGVAVLTGSTKRIAQSSCPGESAYRAAFLPAPRISRLIGNDDELSQKVIGRAVNFIPLTDGFLLFRDDKKILRRRSLFSRENAPIASGLTRFEVQATGPGAINIRLQHEAGPSSEFILRAAKRCPAYEWLG